MNSSIDQQTLLEVLEDVRRFTSNSEDSDWSCMNVPDIVAMLDLAIDRLRNGQSPDLKELRFLFVATGPLQETSMSNGWSDAFLELAAKFDRSIGETT